MLQNPRTINKWQQLQIVKHFGDTPASLAPTETPQCTQSVPESFTFLKNPYPLLEHFCETASKM